MRLESELVEGHIRADPLPQRRNGCIKIGSVGVAVGPELGERSGDDGRYEREVKAYNSFRGLGIAE